MRVKGLRDRILDAKPDANGRYKCAQCRELLEAPDTFLDDCFCSEECVLKFFGIV